MEGEGKCLTARDICRAPELCRYLISKRLIMSNLSGRGRGVPYPQGGGARSNLHLSQHPNVVDELEGHVHQLLVGSPNIHLPTSYQEHIVGLQLLLDLVWGWEKSVMS